MIVLDIDGTLLHTWVRQYLVLRQITCGYGFGYLNLSYSDYIERRREGLANASILKSCGFSSSKIESIVDGWILNIESPYALSFDVLREGVREKLQSFHASGVEIGLLSARQNRSLLANQLTRFDINKFISRLWVVSPQNSSLEKAEILGEYSDIEFFVGDTVSDVSAAEVASIDFIGVLGGQHHSLLLSKSDSIKIVNSISELDREN